MLDFIRRAVNVMRRDIGMRGKEMLPQPMRADDALGRRPALSGEDVPTVPLGDLTAPFQAPDQARDARR